MITIIKKYFGIVGNAGSINSSPKHHVYHETV